MKSKKKIEWNYLKVKKNRIELSESKKKKSNRII